MTEPIELEFTVAWEPPHRLAYLWHLRFDRADATEVELRFAGDEGGGTVVTLVHHGWERLGAAGIERRERNLRGWTGVLGRYRAACAGDGAPPGVSDGQQG